MQLGETILAQSAAAVGVPVLLHRGEPDPEHDPQQDYLERSRRGLALLDGATGTGSGVLALNFHDVPPEHHPVVREQLRRAADLGPCFLEDPSSTASMSVLVAFYDGYRDAALFGAQECEQLGIRALFLPIFTHPEPGRGELGEADLADLARVHTFGFHTASHRSGPEIDESSLEVEVREPVRRLSAAAGGPPAFGAYRGGGRFDPGRPADRALQQLGVRWWLSNWSVEAVPAAPEPAAEELSG